LLVGESSVVVVVVVADETEAARPDIGKSSFSDDGDFGGTD
jgi:hypothetical protein